MAKLPMAYKIENLVAPLDKGIQTHYQLNYSKTALLKVISVTYSCRNAVNSVIKKR